MASNNQNDGVRTLKRIGFQIPSKKEAGIYDFAINPQEYTQTEPARVTITQTKAGAWVDDFGSGLPVVTIKGTTGFKPRNPKDGKPSTGFEEFKELRDYIRSYYDSVSPGTTRSINDYLIFHNYTDGESWYVVPEVFTLMRSVSRPLLYMYEIRMTCIKKYQTPSNKSNTNTTKNKQNNSTTTSAKSKTSSSASSKSATSSKTSSNLKTATKTQPTKSTVTKTKTGTTATSISTSGTTTSKTVTSKTKATTAKSKTGTVKDAGKAPVKPSVGKPKAISTKNPAATKKSSAYKNATIVSNKNAKKPTTTTKKK